MKKTDSIQRAVAFAIAATFVFSANSVFAQSSARAEVADVPHVITYQGLLQSTAGKSVDGPHRIHTTLYADVDGMMPVWQDDFVTPVTQGTFDLALGAQKALPAMSGTLWLGVRIGDDAEMRPLQQLSAAPYAMTVANGAITSEKMGTDYVSSISINGERVTTRGSALNLVAGDGISLSYDPQSSTVALHSAGSSLEKGAKSQGQNSDLNMNGHDILNAPVIMSGAASSTTGTFRLYTSSNSNTASIQSAAQASSRTYTIPDAGASANFVMTAGSQTIGGTKSFSSGIALGNVIDMAGYRITNLGSGTALSDATTKGYVDTINTNLNAAITSEASTRSSAINTLTSNLASETSRAQAAEATLTTSVATEITNRQSAVTAEANTRATADNSNTAAINSEITNRQTAVTAEANARISAVNGVTASLNSEVARAFAAEGNLTTGLNAEITNRQNAVTTEINARTSAVNTLTANLSAEVTNRTNAVSSEASTRAAADNALTSSVSNEIVRATNEESSLQSQIDGLVMPQDLSTTAAPTFDGLTISGGSPIYNYGYLGQFGPSYFFSDLSIYANIVMGGSIDAGFSPILNLPDPVNAQDAANKNYVDVIADGINSELSNQATSLSSINTTLSGLNPISTDYSNAASGTYSAHGASITGNTTNVVNLIGYNASASGSDDQNTGIMASAQGVSSATTIGGDFTASNNSNSGYAIGGRFAASGAATNIAVQATSGSIQVQTAGEGIILKSPNGTCYKLTVGNDGTLTTTAISCP